MASERLYRLPQKKQAMIRKAALLEFSRVPFENVSINRIIQTAEISRGSFYTYFVDKRDLARWLFEEHARCLEEECERTLQSSKGDYFVLLRCMFDHMVRSMKTGAEMMSVVRNIFTSQENAQLIDMGILPVRQDFERPDGPVYKLYNRVNKQKLHVTSMEEFYPLLLLSGASLFTAVKNAYDYPEELEKTRDMFYRSLEIIRRGVCALAENGE